MPKGNPNPVTKFKIGNQISLKWTQELVLQKVQEYIEYCEAEKRHPNLAGYYLHSGMRQRQLQDYEKRNGKDDAVQLLEAYIEDFNVQGLRKHPAGSFIHLKQKRWGWTDAPQEDKGQRVQNIQINIQGDSKEAKAIKQAAKTLKIPESLELPSTKEDKDEN